MTDSFLVRFVWACPKNWRCARCNMKERFHSFKWNRKILFYVHSNFIPTAGVFLESFMSCHCIFKTVQVPKSQCVTVWVTEKLNQEMGSFANEFSFHFKGLLLD